MRGRAAGVAVALALAGCGGSPPVEGPPAPDPVGSGYFVGRTADGLSAAADTTAFDPVALVVSRALMRAPRGAALVTVALLNDANAPVPAPALTARTRSGREVPLVDARVLLARIPGAAARAAAARVRPVSFVPAGGSRLAYLVAVDVRAEDVAGIRMTSGDEVVELSPTRR